MVPVHRFFLFCFFGCFFFHGLGGREEDSRRDFVGKKICSVSFLVFAIAMCVGGSEARVLLRWNTRTHARTHARTRATHIEGFRYGWGWATTHRNIRGRGGERKRKNERESLFFNPRPCCFSTASERENVVGDFVLVCKMSRRLSLSLSNHTPLRGKAGDPDPTSTLPPLPFPLCPFCWLLARTDVDGSLATDDLRRQRSECGRVQARSVLH